MLARLTARVRHVAFLTGPMALIIALFVAGRRWAT
jgi:hypothetical protein